MTIVEKNDDVVATAEPVAVVVDPEKAEQTTVSTTGTGTSTVVSTTRDDPKILNLVTVAEVEDPDKRQAALFCNCCCDILRACIIVNIIYICMNALGLLLSVWGITLLDGIDTTDVEDDDLVTTIEDLSDKFSTLFLISIIEQSVGILFAIVGIVGAAKYMKCMVLATAVWYCIDVGFSFYFANIVGGVIRVVLAYPHIALFVALHKKQITKETYVDRERSCCCDGEK